MGLKLITPPAPILSVYDARRHLNIDSNDFDATLESLIAAATRHIDGREGWLNRALNPQTYDLVYDRFPCSGGVEIPLPPLISVDEVSYVDEDGFNQVFSNVSYQVDDVSEPGWLQLGSEFSWPSLMNTINAVRIRFTAGYAYASGDESTVPFPIRQAILMMVADMYERRESVADGVVSAIPIPSTVKALLHPYRIFA